MPPTANRTHLHTPPIHCLHGMHSHDDATHSLSIPLQAPRTARPAHRPQHPPLQEATPAPPQPPQADSAAAAYQALDQIHPHARTHTTQQSNPPRTSVTLRSYQADSAAGHNYSQSLRMDTPHTTPLHPNQAHIQRSNDPQLTATHMHHSQPPSTSSQGTTPRPTGPHHLHHLPLLCHKSPTSATTLT